MAIFFATLLVFVLFVTALSIGVVLRKKSISTCATARKRGDAGEIGCGACAIIDKEDCNKNPYREYKEATHTL